MHFSKYTLFFPCFAQMRSLSFFLFQISSRIFFFPFFCLESVLIFPFFFFIFLLFKRFLLHFTFPLFPVFPVIFFFSFLLFFCKETENTKTEGKNFPLLLFLIIAFLTEFPPFFVYFKQIYPVLPLFCKMEKVRQLPFGFPPFFLFSPKHTT